MNVEESAARTHRSLRKGPSSEQSPSWLDRQCSSAFQVGERSPSTNLTKLRWTPPDPTLEQSRKGKRILITDRTSNRLNLVVGATQQHLGPLHSEEG